MKIIDRTVLPGITLLTVEELPRTVSNKAKIGDSLYDFSVAYDTRNTIGIKGAVVAGKDIEFV